MGSGQYTIPEGYAAVKLVKAGWRSNNLDPNARHCMASAVAAFMQVYGIDEPAGCYDDIELTDTVVTWGANMAEMHPMLWARVVDHRLRKGSRIFNLTTYSNRTSDAADLEIVFKPQTDLAIWNYIAREIVKRDAVDHEFVNKHCVFAAGPRDIGFGMPATDDHAFPAELDTLARQRVVTLTREEAIAQGLDPSKTTWWSRSRRTGGRPLADHLRRVQEGLEPYTLDFMAELAKGDPDESIDDFKAKLKELADYYADPNARSSRSGRWDSTSTPAAPGSTSRPTWCTCSRASRPGPDRALFRSPVSRRHAAPPARWGPSPTDFPPTWWSPTRSIGHCRKRSGGCRPAPSTPRSAATSPSRCATSSRAPCAGCGCR